ncbi:alpha/beta hydrolase family protein [Rhodohalobacter sulfatireducens]|uniref:Alpha/beta fold hydrolase n=1 Tax=Rhodohalobacter sulfatireducens TaxID=2911366 RepID=A0ABS9KBP4_9BACT|nr:alpha/beta fold hydrolase [Rhodohalobacter sulfatireducens]MCG2588256.1 alpha/beta fold hydrolase [Rhodohalobacter sulfatireducens]
MNYSTVSKKEGKISSTENLPIYYDLYIPGVEHGTALPVVLFVHGFKGFKDWGAFPDLCEELARAGFAVAAFNLSLNGVGSSMTEFDEPELFRRETFSQDLADIGSVIEAIKSKEIESDKAVLDTDRIGLIGHSRGGHTAVVAAAEYSEIQCLVTWSAVADYNKRWSDEMVKDWKTKGYTEITNSRTGQVLPIDKVVFDDAMENADRVIAINRVRELYIPSMFIAGKSDEAVPFSETEKLFRASPATDKEIRLIENAGHTFEISHPFTNNEFPPEFNEALDLTVGWFLDYLR